MPGPFHTLDVICARRQALKYVSSPVCEVDFSSSGQPVIVLNPFRRRRGPTGFRLLVVNGRIRFNWDTTDGAICYSLYRREGGEYVLVEECFPCEPCADDTGDCCHECETCEPGCYAITAITEDGESEPSEEVCVDSLPMCSVTITTSSPLPSADFNAPYSFQLGQEFGLPETEQWSIIAGALPAGLFLSPSGLISGTPIDGGNFDFTASVFALCDALSAGENSKEFSITVLGGPDPTCIYRVADYGSVTGEGTLQPLFIPNPLSPNSAFSEEWNGTFNFLVIGSGGSPDFYWYKGGNGLFLYPDVSVQGKEVVTLSVSGPYPPNDDILETFWQLQLNDPIGNSLIWFGRKVGGDTTTGAGVYLVATFGGGSGTGFDLRPAVLVERCP